jgi:hypothetical protein
MKYVFRKARKVIGKESPCPHIVTFSALGHYQRRKSKG